MVPESQGGRRALRAVGIGLIVVAVLLLIFGAVAYAGWQSGQAQRREAIEQGTAAEMARQMELARADAAAGNVELARLRLDWIEAQDPAFPGLEGARRELAAAIDAAGTATPEATPEPTATPTVTPTPEPTAELESLESLVAAGSWEEAIGAIAGFQAANPDYERERSDRLLYEAYVGRGQELLMGDGIELGLFYLGQAEELGPLPQDVLDQIAWAELYLNGIAFYGVDWAVAINYLYDLCLAAPFYQNACERLRAARIAYGDQFVAAGEWCPAVPYYRRALDQESSRELAEKLAAAQEGCLAATATPTATPIPTATSELTGTPDGETVSAEGTPEPVGP